MTRKIPSVKAQVKSETATKRAGATVQSDRRQAALVWQLPEGHTISSATWPHFLLLNKDQIGKESEQQIPILIKLEGADLGLPLSRLTSFTKSCAGFAIPSSASFAEVEVTLADFARNKSLKQMRLLILLSGIPALTTTFHNWLRKLAQLPNCMLGFEYSAALNADLLPCGPLAVLTINACRQLEIPCLHHIDDKLATTFMHEAEFRSQWQQLSDGFILAIKEDHPLWEILEQHGSRNSYFETR